MSTSTNVSVLLYYLVCPAKFLRGVCLEIARHAIVFLEIGTDQDYVQVQTIPPYSPTKLVRVIKSHTLLPGRSSAGRPQASSIAGAGNAGSDGCSISTIGRHGSEGEIHHYIVQQGWQQGVHQAPYAATVPAFLFSVGIRPMRSDTPRQAAG